MKTPQLGIMTLYMNNKRQIEEKSLFAKWIRIAKSMGMHAFVFTPEETNGAAHKVYAHTYDPVQRKWSRSWLPFPDIIFDRCRYQPTKRFQQLKKFRAQYPNLLYMNRPMANKWATYQLLKNVAEIAPFLPETQLFTDHRALLRVASQGHAAYIKPLNGTGGRGIMRIAQVKPNVYQLQGRNMQRKILRPRLVSGAALNTILAPIRKEGRYLLQQGIDIRLKDGRVHDFRALVQKNGSGSWKLTGVAGRVGPVGSITSNLHGGGKAMSLDELLKRQFSDPARVQSIKQQMEELSLDVVKALERVFKDLSEMALDIAVDRKGRPWLLEVNPKPAREVFARIGEQTTYQTALKRPIEYALWLYKQKKS